MNKTFNNNIRLSELLHYQKDLRGVDTAGVDVLRQENDFYQQIRIEYQPRVPPELFKRLGFSSHHQIDEHTACLIAYHQNEMAGCKLFNLRGKAKLSIPFPYEVQFPAGRVYGFGLFVKPEFRGKGLGKLLNLEAFKLFRGKFEGMDIFLDVGNYVSIRSDEQLGFHKAKTYIFFQTPWLRFTFSVGNGIPYKIYRQTFQIIKFPLKPLAIGVPHLAETVLQWISRQKSELFLNSYSVESAQKDNGPKGIFVCKHNPDPGLLNKIYPQGYSIRKNKTFPRNRLLQEINKDALNQDFLIVDTRFRYIHRNLSDFPDAYIIPKWLEQKNLCFKDLSEFARNRNRDAHKDIRLTSKYNYDYEFSKNEALLKFFYDRMYCPYMHARYPDEKIIASLDYVKKEFRKGGLLLVKDKDTNKYIAASVIKFDRRVFTAVKLGVLNGDPELLHRRAVSALYISYFKFMEQRKIPGIHLGASRSFLNDGVLKYKAKWGAAIEFDRNRGNVFILRICRPSRYMNDFLVNNPFISLENNKLVGNIFTEKDLDAPEMQERARHSHFKGLSELRLIALAATEPPKIVPINTANQQESWKP